MAAYTSASKVSVHVRSVSLPSRSHPLKKNIEEHLCRLRASECNKLGGLKDLYECVDDLFHLPSTQQNLSSCAEDVLSGSLRLLDLCSTTRDAFSQMRASVQDLESSLRRREVNVSNKVRSYLICKKNVNKMFSKCFKLRNNKNSEASSMVSLLKEVEELSVSIFQSIFSSVCPVKETSKQNRWSLVSKLTQSKGVHCQEDLNQVQKMNMALEALYKHKPSKANDILKMEELQKCLMALDMNMQECEAELDCVFRSLIKARVSLLNVLNH